MSAIRKRSMREVTERRLDELFQGLKVLLRIGGLIGLFIAGILLAVGILKHL